MVREPGQPGVRHVALPDDDPEDGRPFRDQRRVAADEEFQPGNAVGFDQFRANLLKVRDHVADSLVHGGTPQLLLALEVVMNERRRHAVQTGDTGQGGPLVTVQTEGLQGSLQDHAARGHIVRR